MEIRELERANIMNLTNKDFETIKKALELLPTGEEFNKLSKEHQDIIVNADTVMVNLLKKKNKKGR